MKLLIDSIKMATNSLLAKKSRSFLSMLGIVIGILTVSSLLSIGFGVKSEVEKQINGLGTNLVTVVPGKISGGNFSSSLGASTLTEDDFKTIKTSEPRAKNAALAMLISGTVKAKSKSLESSIIFAASPGVEKDLNIAIEKGRFNNQTDENTKAKNVVLGDKAANDLFGTNEVLDKSIEIRATKFSVVGVLKKVSSAGNLGGPDLNTAILMPIQTGWEITNTHQVFRIMMQASDTSSVNPVKKSVRDLILKNHKGEEDFSVLSQDDLLNTVGGILNILTAMLGTIAAISLFVGGIGIMNIMLVSVSERTREIGVRKAVGATQGAILLQFLIESIILTLVGGLLAVGIFALGVSAVPKDSPIPIHIDPKVLLLALGFSAVVGVIFGIVPAIGASRKNPIDALRSE